MPCFSASGGEPTSNFKRFFCYFKAPQVAGLGQTLKKHHGLIKNFYRPGAGSYFKAFIAFFVLLAGCTATTNESVKPDYRWTTHPELAEPLEISHDEPGGYYDTLPDLPVYKLRKMAPVKATTAVQVLLFDCKNFEEVESRIQRLKRAGFNTLIFRVFHNKGDRHYYFAHKGSDRGVYFKTGQVPVVDDILGKVAEITHRNGMEIYAWMTTRYADYGVEEMEGWQGMKYDLKTGEFVRTKGLNLFSDDVRDHLKNLYADLSRYDIDGILFQDDLVLRHTEGFSREAREAFNKKYRHMPDPARFYKDVRERSDGSYSVSRYGSWFWEWSRWKNRALLNVAGEIMKEARSIKPEMKFAINFMYEAALKPKDALAWLSQNLREAVKMDFDLYAIMAYHRQMGKELNVKGPELERLVGDLAEKTLQAVNDPGKALIKLQIMDWKSQEVLPVHEVKTMLRIIKEKGGKSLAFVPYKNEFNFTQLPELISDDRAGHMISKR